MTTELRPMIGTKSQSFKRAENLRVSASCAQQGTPKYDVRGWNHNGIPTGKHERNVWSRDEMRADRMPIVSNRQRKLAARVAHAKQARKSA